MFLATIVLTGCSQQQWLSQDELFDKKQECANQKTVIEKDITDSIANDNDWRILKQLWVNIYIEDIFYSPKRNACLYVYNNQNSGYSNHFLVDLFTKEYIIWYSESISSPEEISKFNKTVEELKWE